MSAATGHEEGVQRQHYNVTLAVLITGAVAYALSQTMIAPAIPAIQAILATPVTPVTPVTQAIPATPETRPIPPIHQSSTPPPAMPPRPH